MEETEHQARNPNPKMRESLRMIIEDEKQRRDLRHTVREDVQRLSILHRFQLTEKQDAMEMKQKLESMKNEEQRMKTKIESLEKQRSEDYEEIRSLTDENHLAKMAHTDYMYETEEKILENKITLFQAFPHEEDDGADNDVRRMGHLDADDLIPLFSDETVSQADALFRAQTLSEHLTSDMNELEETEMLEEVMRRHGPYMYRKVRRCRLERRVSAKTGVELLPWNFVESREITLSELSEDIATFMGTHMVYQPLPQED